MKPGRDRSDARRFRGAKKPQPLVVFKGAIEAIFGHLGCYDEYPKINRLRFDYGKNGVTFAQLEALSSLLGTTQIDFAGRTEQYQYSEYTSDTSLKGEIVCEKVKFPAVPETPEKPKVKYRTKGEFPLEVMRQRKPWKRCKLPVGTVFDLVNIRTVLDGVYYEIRANGKMYEYGDLDNSGDDGMAPGIEKLRERMLIMWAEEVRRLA